AWKFASEVQKQFILLLTATPVQNNLEELYNLVTLLEPGLLSTSRQFLRHFVDKRDKLTPRNVPELHGLLAEVMIRNRRSTVGLQFTRRWAKTERIPLSPPEQSLYQDVTEFVRGHLRASKETAALTRMALVMLQMVIFTQFRATQEMLRVRLAGAGLDIAVFHGGLTRLEKESAIERFRGSARLLLCTEAGSEGRNLQFAHAVCNFDLPWNPMKIEQRIGRLSRIGQTHDVHVFNLV